MPDPLVFTTPARTRVRMSNWRHKVWEHAALELDPPSWATPYVSYGREPHGPAQGVPVSAAAALGHEPAIFLRTSVGSSECSGHGQRAGYRRLWGFAGPIVLRNFRPEPDVLIRNFVEAMGLEPLTFLTPDSYGSFCPMLCDTG